MSGTMDDHEFIEIEDEDEEDTEFEEEEEEEEEESEDEDDAYEAAQLIPSVVRSPRVSNLVSLAGNSQEAVVFHEDLADESTVSKSCKGNMESQEDDDEEQEEIDGLLCPICIEAWSSGGEHQISCLPCGHIYGLSCIKKWLQQRRSSGKCPQCNRKCTVKDIRVLYAARLCVVDAELQKKVRTLEAKCASLEKKNADCCKKKVEAQEREADLQLKVRQLKEKTKSLERLLEDRQRESLGSFTTDQGYQRGVINGQHVDSGSGSQPSLGIFALKGVFPVEGGRYFDMDASGELMIVSRRLNGLGGTNILTKISLVAPNEKEDIELPANTKAVRALCIRPCTRLALLASLGKKLSVVSTESNNTVLTYDLQAPAWSCSWDIDSSHHVYTGLQNGMVLAFDMRQTREPLESRNGLSCNPVHTVIPVASDSSATKTILTASQIGICEWNIGTTEERPYLVPESENQGVCISLAHSGSEDIVASFRPKIEISTETSISQSLPTPCMDSCGVQGSHIFYKRTGSRNYQKTGSLLAQMENVRLPKSSIVNKQNHTPIFVSTNEVKSELLLHDISKLAVIQRLKTPKNQIWDVRCTEIWNSCVLGCLSGDMVQLFT